MNNKLSQFVLFLFVAAVLTSVAIADEPVFTSSQGFSITPPDGWTVVSESTATNEIQKKFSKLKDINFDKIAVMILNPADSGVTNLNVVVSPGKLPINEASIEEKVSSALRDQYSQIGVQLDKITVTRKTFGTHQALVADIEVTAPESFLRQWQVMLPASGKTLIVTCSAPISSFDGVTPVFTKAIESMTFSTFEFPFWLRNALIGAIIGGLFGLFQSLTSSREKMSKQ